MLVPTAVPEGEEIVKADLRHGIHNRFNLRQKRKAIARALELSMLIVRKVLRQAAAAALATVVLLIYETHSSFLRLRLDIIYAAIR